MIQSGSELRALVVKAARGAGVPLGHAEDLGAAAADIAALDGIGALLDALKAEKGHLDLQDAQEMTILSAHSMAMAGPTAIDLAACGPVELHCGQKAVLAALLNVANRQGAQLVAGAVTDAILRLDKGTPTVTKPPLGPFEIDGTHLETLHRLAHNTYVPATEASRLAGAGAGLTDND